MRQLALAAILALAACATAPAEAQTSTCRATGYSRADLDALKANQWAIADDAARNTFARALATCVGDPDPTLRDGIAFEALQYMMRQRQLSDATMMALQDDLEARLVGLEGPGFERPFAALVLSEVARADRVQAYLTPERRERLVAAGTAYLRGVRDYRGFSDREGWRHGVAHASDLMLQLTLNPALGKPELERIRDAIGAQVSPSEHAYVFGESERLMTPIIYMARREVFTEAEWTAWLQGLAAPAPFDSWDGAFGSEAKLRKRHNATSFLMQLYTNAHVSQNTADDVLLPGALAALQALP